MTKKYEIGDEIVISKKNKRILKGFKETVDACENAIMVLSLNMNRMRKRLWKTIDQMYPDISTQFLRFDSSKKEWKLVVTETKESKEFLNELEKKLDKVKSDFKNDQL